MGDCEGAGEAVGGSRGGWGTVRGCGARGGSGGL